MVNIDNNNLSAIHKYLLYCPCSASFENVSIMSKESNDFKLRLTSLPLSSLKQIPYCLYSYFDNSVSGYYMFFIIWFPSISLFICNCRLFSFKYYVSKFIKNKMYEHLLPYQAWVWKQWLWKGSREINGFVGLVLIIFLI